MRIPTDIPLATYIRQLIRADRVEEFYWTDEWKELRQDVMQSFHYECQGCLQQGKYTRAICVHHVNHVTRRPDLALSRHYTDHQGKKQYNLIPLCDACHNQAHPEKGWNRKGKERFTTEERW